MPKDEADSPIRQDLLAYGKQAIDQSDIDAVIEALQSDWLTTGPQVEAFEKEFGEYVGQEHCIAISNGTSALHAVMHAIGIGPGDEVIVPAITFAATANSVLYCGGTVVFADILSESLLIDPLDVDKKITSKTKAVIAVDYAGQPADYEALRAICDANDITLVADACHALGASQNGVKVGALADISTFSFHPVKPITTGEGGMISTANKSLANAARVFRNHGITTDHKQRQEKGIHYYKMEVLGYNYRLSDIQCALGRSQLKKIDSFTSKRNVIAEDYNKLLGKVPYLEPMVLSEGNCHAYHLYAVRINPDAVAISRNDIFTFMRRMNIGVNVHYMPVYLHPYYQRNFNYPFNHCPIAEASYENILSLPIHTEMTLDDTNYVFRALKKVEGLSAGISARKK